MTITDPSRRSASEPGDRDEVVAEPTAGRTAMPRGGSWLVAAAVGFAAAQLLPSLGPSSGAEAPKGEPRLALVVSGQPVFNAQPGPDPATSAEVALVNTGAAPVRLAGASADGLGLRWSTDQVLAAGDQAVVVLREGNACARAAEQPDGPGVRQELRVRVGGPAGDDDDLPDEVVLPLPASLVSQYDAFARSSCGLSPVAQGLDLMPGQQSLGRDELLVPVGLVSSTVQRLYLVDVSPTVPGMAVELKGVDGGSLTLPLELPGRYLVDDDIGYGAGVGEIDRYVVSVRLDQDSCRLLRSPALRTRQLVQLAWVTDDDERRLSTTEIGDRDDALRLVCH